MNRYGRVPALNGVGVRRAAILELLSAQIQSKSVLVAFLCYMIAMIVLIEYVHVHDRNDTTCTCMYAACKCRFSVGIERSRKLCTSVRVLQTERLYSTQNEGAGVCPEWRGL